MTQGAGFSSKTAWRKEGAQSAYGEVIECVAGDQAPLITEGIAREITKELDNVIRYKAGYGASDVTGKGRAHAVRPVEFQPGRRGPGGEGEPVPRGRED